MKSMVGAGVLMALMTAGAYSSDALASFDMQVPGQVQPHGPGDKAGKKGAKAERKAEKRADKRAEKAGRKADKPAKPAQADREHPHGGPPGHQQRHRGGPPPWSGGPKKRTEEPPGLAKKDGQPKAKPAKPSRGADKKKQG